MSEESTRRRILKTYRAKDHPRDRTAPNTPPTEPPSASAAGEGGGLVAELKSKMVEHHFTLRQANAVLRKIEPAEARWQADRAALCNLLAIIFRDGGHQASEYGDLAVAAFEAQRVVSETRMLAEDDRARWQAQTEQLRALELDVRKGAIGYSWLDRDKMTGAETRRYNGLGLYMIDLADRLTAILSTAADAGDVRGGGGEDVGA